MTIVMVLHDRLKACDELAASEKILRTGSSDTIIPMVPSSSNGSNRRGSRGREFMAAHVILAILIVSLGTATAALITKLNDDRINRRIRSSREFRQRIDLINRVFYAFNSFVIFTAVDVLALAMYTLRRWKAKRMTDKVFALCDQVAAIAHEQHAPVGPLHSHPDHRSFLPPSHSQPDHLHNPLLAERSQCNDNRRHCGYRPRHPCERGSESSIVGRHDCTDCVTRSVEAEMACLRGKIRCFAFGSIHHPSSSLPWVAVPSNHSFDVTAISCITH